MSQVRHVGSVPWPAVTCEFHLSICPKSISLILISEDSDFVNFVLRKLFCSVLVCFFFYFLYLQEIKLLRGRVFYVLIIIIIMMFGGVSAMKKQKKRDIFVQS